MCRGMKGVTWAPPTSASHLLSLRTLFASRPFACRPPVSASEPLAGRPGPVHKVVGSWVEFIEKFERVLE